jgi:hypothetical protein
MHIESYANSFDFKFFKFLATGILMTLLIFFYLMLRPVFFIYDTVLEIGICFCLQVGPSNAADSYPRN